MESQPRELLGLTAKDLCRYFESLGESSFHGRQLFRSLYKNHRFQFDQLTDLSVALRETLKKRASITLPRLHSCQLSVDGTKKYLLSLADGQRVEAVFIPEQRRNTLCISTQVGCPMACQFCLTATLGLERNLGAGEIVGQILFAQGDRADSLQPEAKPLNIVLMGMGEPLLNLENVAKALSLMSDPTGLAIPAHRITLSTVGLIPQLRQLAQVEVVPNIAISLSATTDEVRDRLMPVNRKYPIRDLIECCVQFPLGPKQKITFEYVLIDGVNDSLSDARRLVKLLSKLRSKVNLLPLNPGLKNGMRPSSPQQISKFREVLNAKGLPNYMRRPRGADIFAACGQLHLASGKNA
jgi:23S rRNA (adenine2503-C2)-methyltransferase